MNMSRTTITTLRALVARLNNYVGMPENAWVREGNENRSIVGCYVLDCTYGGYRLAQIVGDSGGERNITERNTAGVTADLIRAYMDGIREGREPRFPAKLAA
jgi:hypothetical protein